MDKLSIEVNVEEVGEGEEYVHDVSEGVRVIDLLGELGRNSEEVVVKRNEKIVSEKEELEDGDEIVIVPIVSGG